MKKPTPPRISPRAFTTGDDLMQRFGAIFEEIAVSAGWHQTCLYRDTKEKSGKVR